jgi:hypothetical protein
MKFLLCNAFSINMMDRMLGGQNVIFIPVAKAAAKALVENHRRRGEFTCAIGHPDTARVVAGLLDQSENVAEEWAEVAATRPTVTLDRETSLIVAQYRGPRLEVGATELPEGASIEFWQVYHYGGKKWE